MNEQNALLEYESQSPADKPAKQTADKPTTADKLLENTLVFSIENPIAMTMREIDILRLIVAGETNKQIARRLSRSERTVEYHRNRLMRKMSAHNAAELVKRALVMGVV